MHLDLDDLIEPETPQTFRPHGSHQFSHFTEEGDSVAAPVEKANVLAIGYSSLLAIEITIQSRSNLRKDLLIQSEINPNVNEYLDKNKPESYNALKRQLDAAIEDAKRPSEEKVVKNLWSLSKSNE